MQQLKLADGQIIHQLLESRFNEIPKHVIELEDHAARSVEIFQFSRTNTDAKEQADWLGPNGHFPMGAAIPSPLLGELCLAPRSYAGSRCRHRSQKPAECNNRSQWQGNGQRNRLLLFHHHCRQGSKGTRGLLRGGKVVVNEGNVEFRELGGPGGVATEVVIVNGGVIVAQTVHPNVSISIRGETRVFRDPQRRLRAYINEEGELVV